MNLFGEDSKISLRRVITVVWLINTVVLYDLATVLAKDIPDSVYPLTVIVWTFYFLKHARAKGFSVDSTKTEVTYADEDPEQGK